MVNILTYTGDSYTIYLGGEEHDTTVAVRVIRADYDLLGQFAMLPDINGDGYDDWGVLWHYYRGGPDDPRPEDWGFHIFLGSDEPDIMLEKSPDGFGDMGKIAGDDFNGDGIGDIVLKTGGTDEDHGEATELQFHFGSRWFDRGEDVRQADLFVDFGAEYDGVYAYRMSGSIGAVGDYNGDGANDFVWGDHIFAVVFAGSRD